MKKATAILVFAGALALAGAGSEAMADRAQDTASAFKPFQIPGFQTEDAPLHDQQGQNKVYQFDLPGRWGFKFDINQPEAAPVGSNDIDAGAFFKITPSVRVGGSLGFGEKTRTLKPATEVDKPDTKQPRVRLETTLKF